MVGIVGVVTNAVLSSTPNERYSKVDNAMNNPVVAINVYSVPKGKEEDFPCGGMR
jgi:hypothetical protein